jgi:hypothetical protein
MTNRVMQLHKHTAGSIPPVQLRQTPVKATPAPSFAFWQINESTGSSISNLNVVYDPSAVGIQIDWGDGSALENIDSGVNYNHTFA